jgi:hypothetical protein
MLRSAAGLDRPALENFDAIGVRRKLNLLGVADHVKLHQEIAEIDVRRRLVDDDAHGAFGGMCAHIDDAAGKPLIPHGRHRDQHLSVEIAALGALALSSRLDAARLVGRGRLLAGRGRVGGGALRFAALVSRSGLANELHLEMLPDCL